MRILEWLTPAATVDTLDWDEVFRQELPRHPQVEDVGAAERRDDPAQVRGARRPGSRACSPVHPRAASRLATVARWLRP